MLERKHVKVDLEVMDMRKLMLKLMPNGGIYVVYHRVDYLKYDNCYNLNISSKLRYYAMHKALN